MPRMVSMVCGVVKIALRLVPPVSLRRGIVNRSSFWNLGSNSRGGWLCDQHPWSIIQPDGELPMSVSAIYPSGPGELWLVGPTEGCGP